MSEPAGEPVTVLDRSVKALTLLLPLHAMQAHVGYREPTQCLTALQNVLGSLSEDQRWIAVLADWWCAALYGTEVDKSRWMAAQDPVLSGVPEVLNLIIATSHIGDVPALERVVAQQAWPGELEEARRMLVYRGHGQLDTDTELQTFNELVIPLAAYSDALDPTQPPARVPAFPDARQIASYARTHRLQHNSARYLVMERRLRSVWEQFESAVHTLRSAAPWDPAPLNVTFVDVEQIELAGRLAEPARGVPGATEFLTWLDYHLPSTDSPDPTERVEVAAIETVEHTALDWDGFDNQQRIDAWLTLDVEEWMAEGEIPALIAVWGRWYRQLREEFAAWQTESGAARGDLDDIEYAIISGDLDSAQTQLSSAREKHAEAKRLRDRLRSRRTQALEDFRQFDQPPAELVELAARLEAQQAEAIDEALLNDLVLGMARLSQQQRDEQQQHLDEIRAEMVARADVHLERLFSLDPKPSVRAGAEELKAEAAQALTASQAQDAIDKLREYVADHFEDARNSAERAISALRAAGDESGGGLDTEAEADILQIREILDSERPADALRQAGEALERFRRRRPIDSWRADREGEEYLVRRISSYVRQHMTLSDQDVRRFHVAIKTKPFVVLAGLSGSGKSSIARLYSEAIGATTANGRQRRIAVQPGWVDGTETIGYYNPITEKFQPGWLTETLIACEQEPDLPHIVILDEMNLAPVENYLADVLSAMEDRRGGGDAMIRIYARGQGFPGIEDQVPFPANLFIIGTVNTDETTRPLSERVLDRANVVQLELSINDSHHRAARAGTSAKPLLVTLSEWRKISTDLPDPGLHDELAALTRTLASVGVGLGLRSHVEIERFLANAIGVMPRQEAVDAALLQRVIPKLRGFKRAIAPALDELSGAFERLGAASCQFVIDCWRQDAIELDAYLDGSDQSVGLLLSTRVREAAAPAASPVPGTLPSPGAVAAPVLQPPIGALRGQPSLEQLQAFVAELLNVPSNQVNGLVLGPRIGQAVHARWPGFKGPTGWLRDLQKPLGFKLAPPVARKDLIDSGDAGEVGEAEDAVPGARTGPDTPEEYCRLIHDTFASAAWREHFAGQPTGMMLTAAQQWLHAHVPNSEHRGTGMPKFKFAMQVACTGTDYCLDDVGAANGEPCLRLRSRAMRPLPDIPMSELGSADVAREIVRQTSLSTPFPARHSVDLAITWLLRTRRSGLQAHVEELLAEEVGEAQESVRPAIRLLLRAGVLRAEGTAPDLSVHLDQDVHDRADAVRRCRQLVHDCLQSVPWTFEPGVLDELLPAA